MALPLFDFHTNQYYGVLELLSHDPTVRTELILDRALEIAGLRSTHNFTTKLQKPESEITEILELAMETIPRLYLAQVWVPCNHCPKKSTNLCCMKRAAFINSRSKILNLHDEDIGDGMYDYLHACEFHNLQIDLCSSHSNLCDLTISKNPLAHYAQRARMSHCFAISLQSLNNSNHLYLIQFFLQPKFRKDACSDYSPHLLLRIMEMNLKNFKFLEDSQKPNAVECGSIDSLNVIKSYEENFLESNLTTYLEMVVDSCCLRPSSENSDQGWVFCWPARERLCENEVKSNSLLIKEKIEYFMKMIAVNYWEEGDWIVQFWAPKMEDDRCYLQTLDQPYALSRLAKGLASFRKKCMTQYYFVDEQAKEEELGPPGRVFRNGHHETTPDLSHYTTKEFSIRNDAMRCGSRGYFALPIFDDQHNHKCVGVLEFIGFRYYQLEDIGGELEVLSLVKFMRI